MVPAPDEHVTLRDAETARHIARTAAKGAAGDRRPTLEQLLAAFGETDPAPHTRRRVAAALELAGVRTVPGVEHAEPGSRVALSFTGTGGARPSKGTAARRALAGVAVLGAFIGAMALASGIGGDGERADVLPPAPVTTAAATSTTTTTTAPAATTTAATTTSPATTTAQDDAAAAKQAAARRAAERRAAERKRAVGRRVARRRAAARTTVTVRLTPAQATYLCVDDGAGRVLYEGTLTGPRTFKGRQIRLNVGLASTRVTINGRPYRLSGSPAGVNITRRRAVPLPLGDRPCG